MNLAVSDLFMLLKLPVFIYNSLYRGPVLGKFGINILDLSIDLLFIYLSHSLCIYIFTGCDIYGFVSGITGTIIPIAIILQNVSNVDH